jgi:hypothetical protein
MFYDNQMPSNHWASHELFGLYQRKVVQQEQFPSGLYCVLAVIPQTALSLSRNHECLC